MQPKHYYSLVDVVSAMEDRGYAVFRGGNYNLNLVGVRTDQTVTNKFDDTFLCFYTLNGTPIMYQWGCTTDPGTHWIKNGVDKGCAVMKPGQYRGAYKIGKHKGKYEALVQTGAPVTVYRDKNGDGKYDYENPETGYFGCNIHRASDTGTSVQIDKWSAGCQVLADCKDFAKLMELAVISGAHFGNRFTYTLMERKDIVS